MHLNYIKDNCIYSKDNNYLSKANYWDDKKVKSLIKIENYFSSSLIIFFMQILATTFSY